MPAFIFSNEETGCYIVRKGMFRLILNRAATYLHTPEDLEELALSEVVEGISFNLLEEAQRSRMSSALLKAVEKLRQDIEQGAPLEDPVRSGTKDVLDELASFLKENRESERRRDS